jgi:hypothetical protein
MRPSSKIAKLLADELDATAAYLRVQQTAMEIIKEAPSGLPLPDGQMQIIKAAREASEAFEKYEVAVKRYRDFVEHGIVPEDQH